MDVFFFTAENERVLCLEYEKNIDLTCFVLVINK